jgi:DNA-binding GntR family transcriptional regulator
MPEQIAEQITEAVLRGEYQPGDPVPEQELATRFYVSRGPIREALRILEKSGVVRIVPQRGAHITKLTAAEVNDLFQVRRVLYGLLARSVCPATPALIDALDAEVRAMEMLGDREDAWDEHARISLRLGRLMFAACSNRRLVEMLEALVNHTARYTRIGLRERARREQSTAGWRTLVTALRAGNADISASALEGLVEAARLAALNELRGE